MNDMVELLQQHACERQQAEQLCAHDGFIELLQAGLDAKAFASESDDEISPAKLKRFVDSVMKSPGLINDANKLMGYQGNSGENTFSDEYIRTLIHNIEHTDAIIKFFNIKNTYNYEHGIVNEGNQFVFAALDALSASPQRHPYELLDSETVRLLDRFMGPCAEGISHYKSCVQRVRLIKKTISEEVRKQSAGDKPESVVIDGKTRQKIIDAISHSEEGLTISTAEVDLLLDVGKREYLKIESELFDKYGIVSDNAKTLVLEHADYADELMEAIAHAKAIFGSFEEIPPEYIEAFNKHPETSASLMKCIEYCSAQPYYSHGMEKILLDNSHNSDIIYRKRIYIEVELDRLGASKINDSTLALIYSNPEYYKVIVHGLRALQLELIGPRVIALLNKYPQRAFIIGHCLRTIATRIDFDEEIWSALDEVLMKDAPSRKVVPQMPNDVDSLDSFGEYMDAIEHREGFLSQDGKSFDKDLFAKVTIAVLREPGLINPIDHMLRLYPEMIKDLVKHIEFAADIVRFGELSTFCESTNDQYPVVSKSFIEAALAKIEGKPSGHPIELLDEKHVEALRDSEQSYKVEDALAIYDKRNDFVKQAVDILTIEAECNAHMRDEKMWVYSDSLGDKEYIGDKDTVAARYALGNRLIVHKMLEYIANADGVTDKQFKLLTQAAQRRLGEQQVKHLTKQNKQSPRDTKKSSVPSDSLTSTSSTSIAPAGEKPKRGRSKSLSRMASSVKQYRDKAQKGEGEVRRFKKRGGQ